MAPKRPKAVRASIASAAGAPACAAPLPHGDVVQLAHGGGGKLTARLIEGLFVPAFRNSHLEELGDGAVVPFEGSRLDPASLEVTGIKPYHPLRPAIPEKDALQRIFREVRHAVADNGCRRAILVGHNSFFDLSFLSAAVARTDLIDPGAREIAVRACELEVEVDRPWHDVPVRMALEVCAP